MRKVTLESLREKAKQQTEDIVEKFDGLLDGTRVLMLLLREKDGGSHNEFKRRCITEVTHDKEQLQRKLEQMIYFSVTSDEPYRVYMTVNDRNIRNAERVIKERMLMVDFSDEDNRDFFYKRFEYRWHSALMDNSSRNSKYFLLDIDDDCCDWNEVEKKCWAEKIEIVKKYRTKNGWHFITKPFNPVLLDGLCDIQKDSQALLYW